MTGEVSILPGQISTALAVAALLAYPLARLLLWRYVRAVEQAMRSTAPQAAASQHAASVPQQPAPSPSGNADTLLRDLKQLPWRAAAVQAIVTIPVSLWFAWLLLQAGDISVSPYRLIALGCVGLWPGVIAVLLVAGISRTQKLWLFGGGALFYFAVLVWASRLPPLPALLDALRMWLITNLPPTLYLAAFLTPRVRSVGPPVLLVCLCAVSGALGLFAAFSAAPALEQTVLPILFDLGMGAISIIVSVLLLGALLALLAGFWLLNALARAYAQFRIGDQGLLLASLWLVFIIFSSVSLIFDGLGYFALGLLAFPLYLLLVRLLRTLLLPAHTTDAPALLLLRVFARKGETPSLFRAVSRHWRHIGPIRMIAGYDLATETVEPDELMAFLRGRLADGFVTGPEVVDRRLGDGTPRRDGDLRFRAEEFFCFDNTWRYTLQRLVATSAVVVMDLRGFGPQNRGCIFELAELAKTGAMTRSLLLYDRTNTDLDCLRSETAACGLDPGTLPLLEMKGKEAHDLPAMLAALARTATQR